MVTDGSSPRVRGTRSTVGLRWGDCRFIPACAGNSRTAWRRTRGARGSSPRVRGTRAVNDVRELLVRFIPACAGNSPFSNSPSTATAVHPRVCGELLVLGDGGRRSHGSSPRVRGTRLVDHPLRPRRRFIPACAGNSFNALTASRGMTVHPRVCGELVTRSRQSGHSTGSSPRVRGTRRRAPRNAPKVRFIPACAGNSYTVRPVPDVAHGSSPRVRGTRCFRRSSRCRSAVHPRVCGELLSLRSPFARQIGSSPRVRGTHRHTITEVRVNRFIPACAGNSQAYRAGYQ